MPETELEHDMVEFAGEGGIVRLAALTEQFTLVGAELCRLTVPRKPFGPVNVTAKDAVDPVLTVWISAPADIVKSVKMKVVVAPCVRVPLVPVTVTL